ncbi:hypothetical protein EVAR_62790_1 [Eumeta japonica]|uniref:Uncharacterized protein n=1 Tax=Eumeta variegata TaxID=151549 RepID=A0A4C1ZJZ9_EUMVA|nr:hypothetical protein EVAR_62790_1 [Eumeta japonica]
MVSDWQYASPDFELLDAKATVDGDDPIVIPENQPLVRRISLARTRRSLFASSPVLRKGPSGVRNRPTAASSVSLEAGARVRKAELADVRTRTFSH